MTDQVKGLSRCILEFRFVCREYRGLEVLCAWNAKGGNTLLGLRGKALSRLRAAAIAQ